QGGYVRGDRRDEVSIRLGVLQHVPFEEGRHLVEYPHVAGYPNVLSRGVGQPEQVVGDSSPHACPRLRVPPVLNVALNELTGGREEDLLPGHLGFGVNEGEAVL